jgi:hypothetical protein
VLAILEKGTCLFFRFFGETKEAQSAFVRWSAIWVIFFPLKHWICPLISFILPVWCVFQRTEAAPAFSTSSAAFF